MELDSGPLRQGRGERKLPLKSQTEYTTCIQSETDIFSISSPIAQLVKNLPAVQETWVWFLGWEDTLRRKYNPLQYSCLENPMDRGAWWATVHGVMSQTRLSETTTNIYIKYALYCHDTKVMHLSSKVSKSRTRLSDWTELKLQYIGHLMQRADSLEKNLMLGKIEGKRRREQQRMRWLESITDSIDMNLSKLKVKDREAWCAVIHGNTKSPTQMTATEKQQKPLIF